MDRQRELIGAIQKTHADLGEHAPATETLETWSEASLVVMVESLAARFARKKAGTLQQTPSMESEEAALVRRQKRKRKSIVPLEEKDPFETAEVPTEEKLVDK